MAQEEKQNGRREALNACDVSPSVRLAAERAAKEFNATWGIRREDSDYTPWHDERHLRKGAEVVAARRAWLEAVCIASEETDPAEVEPVRFETNEEPDRAREHETPACVFCRRPLRKVNFTPDRFGGHFACFPCNCRESEPARSHFPLKDRPTWRVTLTLENDPAKPQRNRRFERDERDSY